MLSKVLKENIGEFTQRFHSSDELKVREFLFGRTPAAIVSLDGLFDSMAHRDLLRSLMHIDRFEGTPLECAKLRLINQLEVEEFDDYNEIVEKLLYGDSVLFIEGCGSALVVATKKYDKRSIAESSTGSVNRGPREGFTEDMRTSLNQLRRRLRTPDLIMQKLMIGKYTNTSVTVVYIEGVADKEIIDTIMTRLKKIDIDGIIDSNYLVQYLEDRPRSLFKQVGISEKPDVVAAKILEGRAAVVVDGSPIVVTLPYMLVEDLQSGEDYYDRSIHATFLRVLRYISVLVAVLLPGIYVAVQMFNYEILPINMLLTLINATQNIPMPPIVETMIVLLLFEMIHEASIRMPKYSGMAMSIVGALVLGETAVNAGVLCSPSVLITALSSIAIYMIPDQISSLSLLRLIFVLLAGTLGFFGICAGIIVTLIYMASLNYYKTPYLAPFAPFIKKDQKDAVLRATLSGMHERPSSLPTNNRKRSS